MNTFNFSNRFVFFGAVFLFLWVTWRRRGFRASCHNTVFCWVVPLGRSHRRFPTPIRGSTASNYTKSPRHDTVNSRIPRFHENVDHDQNTGSDFASNDQPIARRVGVFAAFLIPQAPLGLLVAQVERFFLHNAAQILHRPFSQSTNPLTHQRSRLGIINVPDFFSNLEKLSNFLLLVFFIFSWFTGKYQRTSWAGFCNERQLICDATCYVARHRQ